jgi:DNA-directed RNA polymerase I, II, and III subunit RPABC5
MTCSKVIGGMYNFYFEKVDNEKKKKSNSDDSLFKIITFNKDKMEKTVEGKVLDELKIKRYCCRRHFLTHVDFS